MDGKGFLLSDDQWGSAGDARDSSTNSHKASEDGWGDPSQDSQSWGGPDRGSRPAASQPQPAADSPRPEPGTVEPPEPGAGRKKLVVAIAIAAIVALAISGVVYATGRSDGDDVSSGSSTSSSSSASQSTQPSASNSTSPSAGESSAPGEQNNCTLDALHRNSAHGEINAIFQCDGKWMRAGAKSTDMNVLLRWNGSTWETIAPAGNVNGFACYDAKRLNRIGAPQSMSSELLLCETESSAASRSSVPRSLPNQGSPGCDGRNILILESVLVKPGDDANQLVQDALNRNPDASVLRPGHCPSLRGHVDGADVYPIYLDFGDDRSALCRTAAQRGGNPRTLNVEGDFTSPCG